MVKLEEKNQNLYILCQFITAIDNINRSDSGL